MVVSGGVGREVLGVGKRKLRRPRREGGSVRLVTEFFSVVVVNFCMYCLLFCRTGSIVSCMMQTRGGENNLEFVYLNHRNSPRFLLDEQPYT